MTTLTERTAHDHWLERVDIGSFNRLGDLLDETTRRLPDKTAISWNDVEITWSALSHAVRGRAARLSQMGIEQGSCVGLALPNSPAFVVSFFAITSLGAIAMPVNPAYTPAEIQEHLNVGRASMLITSEAIANDLRSGNFATDVTVLTTDDRGLEDSGGTMEPTVSPALDTVVLFAFSSGSTGKPKRLSRTHFNLLSEALGFRKTMNMTSDDVVLGIAPLFHAHGLGNGLLASVASGAELVLTDGFDRRKTLDLIVRKGVTFFPGVPLMFSALASLKTLPPREDIALRTCFSAGAPLLAKVSADFKQNFGIPVRQLYGCSEAGSVTINLDDGADFNSDSVGLPIGWGETRIVDEEWNDLPAGTTGEIAIATPTLTATYDDLPEASASAFNDRWFLTGDVGHMDDAGRLFITGRKKVYISTGGFKVDPIEVEHAIASHPMVEEVVVLGIPQRSGEEMVKAVVVGSSELTREVLVNHCKSSLATFKIPRTIEFRDEMPRNPIGKILFKYLM